MALGGWLHHRPSASVEFYDARVNRWFQVAGLIMPQPRSFHGTCIVGSRVYVFGGSDENEVFRSTHMLDVTDLAAGWKSMSGMNHPRAAMAFCVYEGYIWALGGYTDGQYRCETAERSFSYMI
jgi:hypothetical protein